MLHKVTGFGQTKDQRLGMAGNNMVQKNYLERGFGVPELLRSRHLHSREQLWSTCNFR